MSDTLTHERGESTCTPDQLKLYKAEIRRINPLLPDEMIDEILDVWDTHPQIIKNIVSRAEEAVK